jgi:hypothetical protein
VNVGTNKIKTPTARLYTSGNIQFNKGENKGEGKFIDINTGSKSIGARAIDSHQKANSFGSIFQSQFKAEGLV